MNGYSNHTTFHKFKSKKQQNYKTKLQKFDPGMPTGLLGGQFSQIWLLLKPTGLQNFRLATSKETGSRLATFHLIWPPKFLTGYRPKNWLQTGYFSSKFWNFRDFPERSGFSRFEKFSTSGPEKIYKSLCL